MKSTVLCIISLLIVSFVYSQQSDTLVIVTDSTVITTITTVTPNSDNSTIDNSTSKPVETTQAPQPEQKKVEKQRRDTRPIHQRISFGLGGSVWANSNEFYIEAIPSLAYRFPKILTTGVGYRYIWRNQLKSDEVLRTYGPTLFARANLIKRLYAWTEYEILKNEFFVDVPGQDTYKNSNTIDSWFVGLGYVKSVGRKGRGGLSVQVLYNVLYNNDSNSPYYSPVTYRVGYFF